MSSPKGFCNACGGNNNRTKHDQNHEDFDHLPIDIDERDFIMFCEFCYKDKVEAVHNREHRKFDHPFFETIDDLRKLYAYMESVCDVDACSVCGFIEYGHGHKNHKTMIKGESSYGTHGNLVINIVTEYIPPTEYQKKKRLKRINKK